VSQRAKELFDQVDEAAASYPEVMRRTLARRLQGNISLSTQIRRERSKEIIGIPSNWVVLIVRASITNKLKRDINLAYPNDDDELPTPAPEVFRPRRRQRSPAQLQALQRENDRRRQAKLAKAIRDREALVSQRGSDGR
jgi:hypothetical protein